MPGEGEAEERLAPSAVTGRQAGQEGTRDLRLVQACGRLPQPGHGVVMGEAGLDIGREPGRGQLLLLLQT